MKFLIKIILFLIFSIFTINNTFSENEKIHNLFKNIVYEKNIALDKKLIININNLTSPIIELEYDKIKSNYQSNLKKEIISLEEKLYILKIESLKLSKEININSNNNLNTEEINKKIKEQEKIEELELEIEEKIKIIKQKKYKKIDLPEIDIIFEWGIPWEETISWAVFEKTFETFWNKEINLSIYKISWGNKTLITSHKIITFVYKTKITQIFQKSLWKKIKNFIFRANESWIFIEKFIIDTHEIWKFNFKENILKKLNNTKYLTIWWDKDFIFDSLSKINTENTTNKISLVLISSFNINILQKYLQNFTLNKSRINNSILLDESSKYEILKQPENIEVLKVEIKNNNYEFLNLNTKTEINSFLFLSKFINNLSNSWFSTQNIYLLLIIPFLLLWVSIFKHLIWLSPAWILIPTSLTLLFFKLSFIPIIILIIILLLINLFLSKIIIKYSLHYTPKITLITIINIIILIIAINIGIQQNYINININDIMLIIFFILISEKLIHIIISKEFWEYKNTLLNTFIFTIISYLFFNITIIKTFILTYPETIILLIPIAFLIWRFTWLRITEYFRFREVIKWIEE